MSCLASATPSFASSVSTLTPARERTQGTDLQTVGLTAPKLQENGCTGLSWLLTSFSLTQLKDLSGWEGWGTHFFLSETSLLGKGSGGTGRPMPKQGGAPGGVGGPPGGRGGGGGGQQANGKGGAGGGRSLVVIEEVKVSGPPGGGGEDTGPVCDETEKSEQSFSNDTFQVSDYYSFPYSYSLSIYTRSPILLLPPTYIELPFSLCISNIHCTHNHRYTDTYVKHSHTDTEQTLSHYNATAGLAQRVV